MNYILTMNNEILKYKKIYTEIISQINKIHNETKKIHNSLYSVEKDFKKINELIKKIYDYLQAYYEKTYELSRQQIVLEDINTRLSLDYDSIDETDLIDIDGLRKNIKLDNVNEIRIDFYKVGKSLESIGCLIPTREMVLIDRKHVEVYRSLFEIIKNLASLSTPSEIEEFDNKYPLNKIYNNYDISQLKPVYQEKDLFRLQDILNRLKNNPLLKIELEGLEVDLGKPTYNYLEILESLLNNDKLLAKLNINDLKLIKEFNDIFTKEVLNSTNNKVSKIDKVIKEYYNRPKIKIIIEGRQIDESITDYEIYLSKKYKLAGYTARYVNDIRQPYPHEENKREFINDKGEKIEITKDYSNKDYYQKEYIPYIKVSKVTLGELIICMNKVKNRIYNSIAVSLIEKGEQLTEDKFIQILSFLEGKEYITNDYLKYYIKDNNNKFYIDLTYKNTKMKFRLEYKTMERIFDSVYRYLLPRKPIFKGIQNVDSYYNKVYEDTNNTERLSYSTKKGIIETFLKQKIRRNNWISGARYYHEGAPKDVVGIDLYGNKNSKITINLERIKNKISA